MKTISLFRMLLSLCLLASLGGPFAWGEGEEDPLWNRPTFEKKLFKVGLRILETNGITEKIVFEVQHDKNKKNAYADDRYAVVTVEKGLLNYFESDDELAAVLSHEIAHIISRHGQKTHAGSVVRGVLITAPLTVAGALGGVGGVYLANRLGHGINVMATSASSRGFETQADEIGMGLLIKSGYDPKAFLTVARKIFSDGGRSRVWRSHPLGRERISHLEKLLKEHDSTIAAQEKEKMASPVEVEAVLLNQTIDLPEASSYSNAFHSTKGAAVLPLNSARQPDTLVPTPGKTQPTPKVEVNYLDETDDELKQE